MTIDKEVNPRFEKTYKIYKHVFPNGKVYIGITSRDLNVRWDSGKGYGDTLMGRAVKKYGWDNIKHYVLKGDFTESQAKTKERELIAKYHSMDYAYGYNQTAGGDGSLGYKHSDVAKKKMSQNHADVSGLNNPFFGKHHSEETCEQLRLINKGKAISKESRKKISIAMSGENHPLYGTHCSEERKRKISESNKGVLLGVKFTEDHKKKLSESVRQSWNNRPRTFSEETRRKMSEAQLKRHRKEVI